MVELARFIEIFVLILFPDVLTCHMSIYDCLLVFLLLKRLKELLYVYKAIQFCSFGIFSVQKSLTLN